MGSFKWDTKYRRVKGMLRIMVGEVSQEGSCAAGLESSSPEWRKGKSAPGGIFPRKKK